MKGRLFKLETVCEEVEKVLMAKPEADAIEALNTKIINLKKFIQNYEKVIIKKIYDKRLNILIYGIKKDKNQTWEEKR